MARIMHDLDEARSSHLLEGPPQYLEGFFDVGTPIFDTLESEFTERAIAEINTEIAATKRALGLERLLQDVMSAESKPSLKERVGNFFLKGLK